MPHDGAVGVPPPGTHDMKPNTAYTVSTIVRRPHQRGTQTYAGLVSDVPPVVSPPAEWSQRREIVRWVGIPIAIVIVLIGLFEIASAMGVGQCSPPTQNELKAQQRFVSAHIADASQFELEAVDCDDDGMGWVNFSTKMTPSVARDAFIADGSCAVTDPPEGRTSAAECQSGRFKVSLLFGPSSDTDGTSGELIMEQDSGL